MDRIDDLIGELAGEGARPPGLHPGYRCLVWLCVILVYLAGLSLVLGFRPDLGQKLAEAPYQLELVFLAAIIVTASLASAWLTLPDLNQQPWIRYLPLVPLAGFVLLVLATGKDIGWSGLMAGAAKTSVDCVWHILMFSVPPGLLIFLMMRQGATVRCCWAGGLATLTVSAFGYLCMRLIEPNDSVAHLLVWHMLPLVVMCILGMIAGRFVFRW